MGRYKDSYRVLHKLKYYEAIATIDKATYDRYKALNHDDLTFMGNGVVRSIIVHYNYALYQQIVHEYKGIV